MSEASQYANTGIIYKSYKAKNQIDLNKCYR